jgi:hypothetical protein
LAELRRLFLRNIGFFAKRRAIRVQKRAGGASSEYVAVRTHENGIAFVRRQLVLQRWRERRELCVSKRVDRDLVSVV